VLGGVWFGGEFDFKFFFDISLVCCFSCHLMILRLFLLLDDLFEFFLAFGLLAVLHGVFDSKFKLYVFLLSMYSSKGEIEKLSDQYLNLIVISH
jgi:hypothetical protein